MAVQRDRITVFPPDGESVVVDILESSVSLGTVHAERAKPRTLTLPLTISERTSFFVPAGSGPYTVSVKLDGAEIAGPDGAAVTVSSFPAEVRARIDADELGSVASPSGGSSTGVPVVKSLVFAFDDAGLADGLPIYTPAVGDILLNAWIEVKTAWDGTTPLGDFGQDLPADTGCGWLCYARSQWPMDQADVDGQWFAHGLDTQNSFVTGGATESLGNTTPAITARVLPARINNTAPVKVWVSQDGLAGGADPGATQGLAVACLLVVAGVPNQ